MPTYEIPLIPNNKIVTYDIGNISDSIDWRECGVVLPIRDQGRCFSSWAFATASSIESAQGILTNKTKYLSTQQLIDCSGAYGSQGCYFGTPTQAFSYVLANGIVKDSKYPYVSSDQQCKSKKVKKPYAQISDFKYVSPNDADSLLAAVAVQPVTVSVDADQTVWQLYRSGVLTEDCGDTLNHAVTIVGYNMTETPPYWIVRNSWGDWWGEEGYIRIAVVSGSGLCGINMLPIFPIL